MTADIHTSRFASVTCGEHGFLGKRLVVDDGELRQLDVLHSSDGAWITSSLPVELDVVGGVSIWEKAKEQNKLQTSSERCVPIQK